MLTFTLISEVEFFWGQFGIRKGTKTGMEQQPFLSAFKTLTIFLQNENIQGVDVLHCVPRYTEELQPQLKFMIDLGFGMVKLKAPLNFTNNMSPIYFIQVLSRVTVGILGSHALVCSVALQSILVWDVV